MPAVERIVVVLGASADLILGRVDFLNSEPVVCDDWREGQAASLRRGVEELRGAQKVIVTLGDEPLITPQVVARFAARPRAGPGNVRRHPGTPCVPRPQAADRDRRAHRRPRRAGAARGGSRMIECGHLCSGRDVDTCEDLEAIRSEARAVI